MNEIGIFEMKPAVDICENCAYCDLEVETHGYHYVGLPEKTEYRGRCKHADACQVVFERCMRERGE